MAAQAWIAQPQQMPSPWEFWGHVDHGMKAGLCFVLTTSFEPFAPVPGVEIATSTLLKLGEIK